MLGETLASNAARTAGWHLASSVFGPRQPAPIVDTSRSIYDHSMTKQRMVRLIGSAMLLVLGLGATGASVADEPIPVKVMIINMFDLEAAPWIAALKPQREVRVPGLSSDYPLVRCTTSGVCQMTTGMGHANAAASLTALIYSGQFDLRRTYFLI